MCPASSIRLSVLLANRGHGDQEAREALVYTEVPRIARRYLRRERPGLSIEDTGMVLGLSPATGKRKSTTAQAWLHREIQKDVLE
jgi:hypothetical protein